MQKPEGILFDLDDTIISFSNASMKAWKKCCDNFVIENNVSFDSHELFQTVIQVRKWFVGFRNGILRKDKKNIQFEFTGFIDLQ